MTPRSLRRCTSASCRCRGPFPDRLDIALDTYGLETIAEAAMVDTVGDMLGPEPNLTHEEEDYLYWALIDLIDRYANDGRRIHACPWKLARELLQRRGLLGPRGPARIHPPRAA